MIPAFGLGILILLIWYLSTKASKLELDESRIKHEKGLLSKERRALSMSSVRTGPHATIIHRPHLRSRNGLRCTQQAMCPKSWLVGSPTQITSVNSL